MAKITPGSFSVGASNAQFAITNSTFGTATGNSTTNICAAQAVAGAGALTINGTLVNGGVAYLNPAGYVIITSAGNDTGITFTVVGQLYGPNGNVQTQSEAVTGSNASVVSTTKTYSNITSITASGAAAGNVSVGTNATVATLDKPRRIMITSAGNDSGITFTVSGTDWNNANISQAVTGGNATTAVTTLDFATVTKIIASAATASTVTVGTNGVAGSRPICFDQFGFPQISLQVSVTGTVNYTVQQSLDDPNRVGLASMNWVNHPDSTLVAATATAQGNYAYLPQVSRVVLNSGTGSITLTAIQAANVPL